MHETADFETEYAVKTKAQLVLELEALKRRFRELESRSAERQHAADLLRLQALILDAVSDSVVITDIDGEIVDWTAPAAEMFGYDKKEVLGQTTDFLYRPDELEAFTETVAKSLRREGHWTGDNVFVRKDGTEGISRTVILAFRDQDGDHMATVHVFRDMTKRRLGAAALKDVHNTLETWIRQRTSQLRSTNKKLELEIAERKQAEAAVSAAKREAELANRAKSDFLANMSHELRTPLNAIVGFAEVLSNELFGPIGNAKYRDYAMDINASGRHLLDLINDILDLSKIESGSIELNEETFDVRPVIRSCMTLMAERARSGNVAVHVETRDGQQPGLFADKRMVRQILVNLISNAIKFTPPGGKVSVKAWHGRDGYLLQIVDSGVGIAPEDIPKAMARFGQIDGKLARRHEGSGLGLPLAGSLVDLHGGTLDIESELDVGTTVTVRFPTERVIEPSAKAMAPRAGQWVAS